MFLIIIEIILIFVLALFFSRKFMKLLIVNYVKCQFTNINYKF